MGSEDSKKRDRWREGGKEVEGAIIREKERLRERKREKKGERG